MSGPVLQIAQVLGFLLVLAMVHTGSAAAAGSSRNTRQECEDQLENTSCLDIKDKGKCDSIDPQLCRKTCGLCPMPKCEDQLENTSCLEVKDKGDCDSIDPQLCQKTCGLCPVPSSGCPEGFFTPRGSSSQCFKVFVQPERNWRNWTEAREFCILNGLTLAQPNDDVNLEELGTYVGDTLAWGSASPTGAWGPWLGGRWSDSTSGFLWEADVGEQPGSSSGRRELDESHPGWHPGWPSRVFPEHPGPHVGNNWCLAMDAGESTPYYSRPCSWGRPTLCHTVIGS